MRLILLFAISLPLYAGGVELQIQYSAIQKVLAQQLFDGKGRMWVRGTAQDLCSYAYLENPLLTGTEGKVEIRARFSGRNGNHFLGRCWGLGDEFDLQIVATPYYSDGLIRLQDVEVSTPEKKSYYSKKVREAVAGNLTQKFEYRVSDEARRILENKRENEPYQQQLANFQVSRIRVTQAALVLNLEFTLIVK